MDDLAKMILQKKELITPSVQMSIELIHNEVEFVSNLPCTHYQHP